MKKAGVYQTPLEALSKVFLLLTGLLVFMTLLLAGSKVIRLRTQALEPIAPRNITVTNLAAKGATISWYTRVPVNGYVVVVNSDRETLPAFMDDRVSGVGEGKFYTHYVTIRGLKPEETYRVKIYSDNHLFKTVDGKKMVTFKTLPLDNTPPPPPQNIFGRIVTSSGSPASDVILYAYPTSGTEISTVTDKEGKYVLNLLSSRDPKTGSVITTLGEKIRISAVMGEEGKSDIVVDLNERGLIPTIQLGKDYDFSINYPPENKVLKSNEVQIKGSGRAGERLKIKVK